MGVVIKLAGVLDFVAASVKLFHMDFWMLERQNLPGDLPDVFTALGDLQHRYDWVISDHDLYFAPNTPDTVRERWSWTGLLMGGRELTEHLTAGYVTFVTGGILSAVPKGTLPEQVREYVPCWEIKNFGSSDYCFQTPYTQMELICYDGYAWVIVCQPEMTPRVQKAFPQAKAPDDFYKEQW